VDATLPKRRPATPYEMLAIPAAGELAATVVSVAADDLARRWSR
jgi:hypothetical protein